jgi:hypothetical protein
MIRPNTLRTLTIAILIFSCAAFAAQHRATRKKKPSAPAAPPPPTVQNCGMSVHIPPGWELMRASEYEAKHPEATPEAPSKPATEPVDTNSAQPSSESPSQPSEAPPQTTPEQPANPTPKPAQIAPSDNPCSFVLAPKYPSELARNTDAEGPVGRMELEIVNSDLDTAAAQLFEKDEKGWYVNGPNGTRYDARLNKPKRGLQTLTAVIVEGCHDLNGKYRGLCESNRYVYSNGRRSAVISAGPYLGETEFTILNSIRFAPAAASPRSRTRKKR